MQIFKSRCSFVMPDTKARERHTDASVWGHGAAPGTCLPYRHFPRPRDPRLAVLGCTDTGGRTPPTLFTGYFPFTEEILEGSSFSVFQLISKRVDPSPVPFLVPIRTHVLEGTPLSFALPAAPSSTAGPQGHPVRNKRAGAEGLPSKPPSLAELSADESV